MSGSDHTVGAAAPLLPKHAKNRTLSPLHTVDRLGGSGLKPEAESAAKVATGVPLHVPAWIWTTCASTLSMPRAVAKSTVVPPSVPVAVFRKMWNCVVEAPVSIFPMRVKPAAVGSMIVEPPGEYRVVISTMSRSPALTIAGICTG